MVEAIRSIPGELQMLSLIFTNGDMGGSSRILALGNSLVARGENLLMNKDIGRLKDRV